MVFGEINSFLNIWDRLRKWHASRKTPIATETVAARFVRLFESHGVHRNQIPRFFGFGLTLKDVQDDVSLITRLNDDMLEAACTRFAVRREWLDGAEPQIHPDNDFYKHPKEFLKFQKDLRANNPDGELRGVLIAPEERDVNAEALLILQETIGFIGDKPIYRFHLCNNWSFTYWKSRCYLTACVAIAWEHQVFIHGTTLPKKEIKQLAYGQTLLGWQGEGIWFLGNRKWYPEDMALQPEVYLDGIDPELDNFGIAAGLSLWLKLEEQGFMDTGISADAKQLFQQELAKYTSA